MAQFSVNTHRFDPYKNFKFRIKWDGRYVAGVSKVGALKRTTEVVEHREGGDPSTSRKSPGRTKYEAITLERGVTHDPEFENWANKVWHVGAGLGAGFSRQHLAHGFFFQAAQAFAAHQLGHHIGRAQPVVGQRDHAVEPQVGGFVDQLAAVAAVVEVLGGHDQLGRFLAHLLQEGIGPLVEQPGHIALVRVAAVGRLAGFDDGSQPLQVVGQGHGVTCRWRTGPSGPVRRCARHPPRSAGRSSCAGRCGRQCRARARAASP